MRMIAVLILAGGMLSTAAAPATSQTPGEEYLRRLREAEAAQAEQERQEARERARRDTLCEACLADVERALREAGYSDAEIDGQRRAIAAFCTERVETVVPGIICRTAPPPTQPVPRDLILPPADRPGSVRGNEATIHVFVGPDGRVVPDSTHIDPSTGDAAFAARLREQAAGWLFEPARQDGEPVGAWYHYTIGL